MKRWAIKDRNDKDLTEAEEFKKRWQENTEELIKRPLMTLIATRCGHSPNARHPGMWSQVGLRKHYYEQS